MSFGTTSRCPGFRLATEGRGRAMEWRPYNSMRAPHFLIEFLLLDVDVCPRDLQGKDLSSGRAGQAQSIP